MCVCACVPSCLLRIDSCVIGVLPTNHPSSFLAPALLQRRLSHNAASSLRSTQRHPTLRVVCAYLLSGAFAHSGSSLAHPDPSTHLRTPLTVAGRAQPDNQHRTSTGERQCVFTPCPSPNRALRVYACMCCHLHTFVPAFTVEPACARALSVYEVCSLTRLPPLPWHMCTHHSSNPLCAPPPRHCAPCCCVICVVRHHRVFLPSPAHTFGDG